MADRDRFERGLARDAANFQPLSPLGFLDWAANTFPDKLAVIDGDTRFTYRQFAERCRASPARSRRGGWVRATSSRCWRRTARRCWRAIMASRSPAPC